MSKNVAPIRKETEFTLSLLKEIPTQYKATIELNILGVNNSTSWKTRKYGVLFTIRKTINATYMSKMRIILSLSIQEGRRRRNILEDPIERDMRLIEDIGKETMRHTMEAEGELRHSRGTTGQHHTLWEGRRGEEEGQAEGEGPCEKSEHIGRREESAETIHIAKMETSERRRREERRSETWRRGGRGPRRTPRRDRRHERH
ncbi:hypothetical protein Tco_0064779 [Tanacetum coccineum]